MKSNSDRPGWWVVTNPFGKVVLFEEEGAVGIIDVVQLVEATDGARVIISGEVMEYDETVFAE
jgi:hypothetical protein